jgi:hypothetical protein
MAARLLDDKTLSERYGLDQRTVHLLPAKTANNFYPQPLPSTNQPSTNNAGSSAWQTMNNNYGSGHKYPATLYWRRYIAILEKHGARQFAKVIIQEDLEPWAKRRGFAIIRQFRAYGTINEKMEKTEFTRRAPK